MPTKSFHRTDRVSAQLRRELGTLVHNAVREHRLRIGARGEDGVAVNRLVRPSVLDSECAPPGESPVPHNRNRGRGQFGLLKPLRDSGLPPVDQRLEGRICRSPPPPASPGRLQQDSTRRESRGAAPGQGRRQVDQAQRRPGEVYRRVAGRPVQAGALSLLTASSVLPQAGAS